MGGCCSTGESGYIAFPGLYAWEDAALQGSRTVLPLLAGVHGNRASMAAPDTHMLLC